MQHEEDLLDAGGAQALDHDLEQRLAPHAQHGLAQVAVGGEADQTPPAVDHEGELLATLRDALERLAQRGALADEHVVQVVHATSRFTTSRGPSSTSRSTRTMRSAAWPSP